MRLILIETFFSIYLILKKYLMYFKHGVRLKKINLIMMKHVTSIIKIK